MDVEMPAAFVATAVVIPMRSDIGTREDSVDYGGVVMLGCLPCRMQVKPRRSGHEQHACDEHKRHSRYTSTRICQPEHGAECAGARLKSMAHDLYPRRV